MNKITKTKLIINIKTLIVGMLIASAGLYVVEIILIVMRIHLNALLCAWTFIATIVSALLFLTVCVPSVKRMDKIYHRRV